jgi:hypothetical protein
MKPQKYMRISFKFINLKKQELAIITSFIALLFFSFVFLSVWEKIKLSEVQNGNLWLTYFSSTQNTDFDFVIENYSPQKDFTWKILENDNQVAEGKSTVKNKEISHITVSGLDVSHWSSQTKLSVVLTSGTEQKEIYKIINQ